MKYKALIISILINFTLLFATKQINACICYEGPFKDRLKNSDAIFVGKIISIQDFNYYPPFAHFIGGKVFEIEVIESWQTAKYSKEFPKYVTIFGSSMKACGTNFAKGYHYLFYTHLKNYILHNDSFCGDWGTYSRQSEIDSLNNLGIKKLSLWYPKEIQKTFPRSKVRDEQKETLIQIIREEGEEKIQKLKSDFEARETRRFYYELLGILFFLSLIFSLWFKART